MNVVATAGHVDHGKSLLLSALTGMQTDRHVQERQRGQTIDLGFCWTNLGSAGDVAFIDVPGHERFINTMLAGVGSRPAVLFCVAADGGWMPQSAEHLAILDAIGCTNAVVAVTRTDLADPATAIGEAEREFAATSMSGAAIVPVCAKDGTGLSDLRSRLAQMLEVIPLPHADSDVRLWIDRSFVVHGAGRVVTGTLQAGTLTVGDTLQIQDTQVRVRGIETLGRAVSSIVGSARVALNVAGPDASLAGSGMCLTTPDRWIYTSEFDMRLRSGTGPLPRQVGLHFGTHRTSARARTLDDRHIRVMLQTAIPLRVGDRVVLRDPSTRVTWAGSVLDPVPPKLTRRGDAKRRATVLASAPNNASLAFELQTRGLVQRSKLVQLGVEVPVSLTAEGGPWLLSDQKAEKIREGLQELLDMNNAEPVPVPEVMGWLGCEDLAILQGVVKPPLRMETGFVLGEGTWTVVVDELVRGECQIRPITVEWLKANAVSPRVLRYCTASGVLVPIVSGVWLSSADVGRLPSVLRELPDPFTASEARQALGLSRRCTLQILNHLDSRGVTLRHQDSRRSIRS
ncbi:MAG: selenocysteine-specific translation elongation factor [Actinomycetia bacterium]|nr:selenocysteine-specific translation elongation factor [Actinomycetes bacterium]